MCVIVYKPKKANVTKKTLEKCWNENPHSAGFMFAADGNLVIQKGYTSFEKFYTDFRKQEKIHKENFVLHFRIATHGGINEANCHPFNVSKNIGFAHNGILNCVDTTKDKSDTFVFCEQVLRKLPVDFLTKTEYRIMLESVCKAETSKFIFMTNKGITYIFNESSGAWQDGCWFSNMNFDNAVSLNKWSKFPTRNKNKVQNRTYKYEFYEYVECVWCGDYFPEKSSHVSCCRECAEELEQDKFPIDY